METLEKEKQSLKHKIMNIIGIVFCAILLPILIVNIVMIINSFASKDEVPSIGKYVPFVIQSGSMSGTIEGGDIIITTKVDPSDVKIDDIITFYDPKGNGTTTVTHRVIDIKEVDGKLVFTTIGDVVRNENIEKYGDFESIPEELLQVISETVPESKLISKYKFRIPVVGHISLFMSTTPGFIVCVFLPLLLLVGYDVIRRKMYDKENNKDKEALLEELEALRAKQKQNENQNSNEE